jgi:hypothetical protein
VRRKGRKKKGCKEHLLFDWKACSIFRKYRDVVCEDDHRAPFAGLRGTSRDFAGLRAMRALSGISRHFAALRGISQNSRNSRP